MKNLVFLAVSFFCFCIYTSCGEENFEPYSYEGYDKSKGLLPYEFTHSYIDEDTGIPTTDITELKYDSKNRLTAVNVYSSSKAIRVSQEITYNESTGEVNTVKINIPPLEEYLYTYEYPEKNKILEHVIGNGIEGQTFTLLLTGSQRLSIKNDPDFGDTQFGFDVSGNLVKVGNDTRFYDTTRGIMSNVKTPHWLFYTLEGSLPFSYNLGNNIVLDEEGTTYGYDDFTYSQFPKKMIINGDEEIIIKYRLSQ
jgi:hypothetical protein